MTIIYYYNKRYNTVKDCFNDMIQTSSLCNKTKAEKEIAYQKLRYMCKDKGTYKLRQRDLYYIMGRGLPKRLITEE